MVYEPGASNGYIAFLIMVTYIIYEVKLFSKILPL